MKKLDTSSQVLPINGQIIIKDQTTFLNLRAELNQRLEDKKKQSLEVLEVQHDSLQHLQNTVLVPIVPIVPIEKNNIPRPNTQELIDLSKDPFHAKILNKSNKLFPDLVPYSEKQTLNDDTFLYQIIDALIFLATYD